MNEQAFTEWLSDQPCPDCGEKELGLESRLVVKPFGTYSLAGAQPKLAATATAFIVCGGCGFEKAPKSKKKETE